MTFKSIPKLLGKIVIIFALVNTFLDICTIFVVRTAGPPGQQFVPQIDLQVQNNVQVKLVESDPVVVNDPLQQKESGISDNDYLILTSAPEKISSAIKISQKQSKKFVDDGVDFEIQLHKQFWKEYKNVNHTRRNFDERDKDFLVKFRNLSLWPSHNDNKRGWVDQGHKGSWRKTEREENGFGFGPNYDSRIMAQYLWGVYAPQINPDLFMGVKGNKTKRIMIRDTFAWWNYKGGRQLRCPGSPFDGRCELTQNRRSSVNQQIDAYILVRDAYHISHPMISRNSSTIYFILESPISSPQVNLFRPNDYLASFWRGSDIQTSYGKWAYYNPTIRKMKQTKNYAAGKTRMAAIFVSNCEASNDRLKYVKELSQFVQIDVYGECGSFKCGHDKQNSCFAHLKTHYRFYLAFENSNCRDYITEKFFVNALQNDVVPIVLGAHPDDYKAAAPEGSYIQAEDFGSPRLLAAYMEHLAKNEDEYNKYFEWKGTGEILGVNFFCRVCSFLFYADENPREEKSLRESLGENDLWKYHWSPQQQRDKPMCLTRGRWYWTRGNKDSLTKFNTREPLYEQQEQQHELDNNIT